MVMAKCADVVTLRSYVHRQTPAMEHALLGALPPGLQELYASVSTKAWLPLEQIVPIYEAGAAAIFPGDPEAMRNLGRLLASRTYAGPFRFLLRIPTLTHLLRRSALIWSNFYDAGVGFIENESRRSAEFVVRGLPELPLAMREFVCGHFLALGEIVGVANVRIEPVADDPNAWRWRLTWE